MPHGLRVLNLNVACRTNAVEMRILLSRHHHHDSRQRALTMSTNQSPQASTNIESTCQPQLQQQQQQQRQEYASSERCAALLSELVTIMQAQTTQFDRLDARFNSINAQFDSIDARLDQVDASFDCLVSGTEQTFAALRNRRELIRQLLERRRQAGNLHLRPRTIAFRKPRATEMSH